MTISRRFNVIGSRSKLAASAARHVALLERRVLSAAGLIDQKAAEQAGSGTDPGAERGIAADRPDDRPATGADGGAGERALLGRGHVGAGDDRRQPPIYCSSEPPGVCSISATKSRDSVRSKSGKARRLPVGSCAPAQPVPNRRIHPSPASASVVDQADRTAFIRERRPCSASPP
jgi:hypothetical protein